MKRYLKAILKHYWQTNDDEHKLDHYDHMMREHPGWAVHKAFLIHCLQEIGNEMLSERFSKKTADEKDVLQRTYCNMAEVIKFLLDPMAEVRKQAKVIQHNKKMQETTKKK